MGSSNERKDQSLFSLCCGSRRRQVMLMYLLGATFGVFYFAWKLSKAGVYPENTFASRSAPLTREAVAYAAKDLEKERAKRAAEKEVFAATVGNNAELETRIAENVGDPRWQQLLVKKRGPRYKVVVMVMSARNHKPERDAIRKTWAQDAQHYNVSVRFSVGAHGCPPQEQLLRDCNVNVGDPNDVESERQNAELEKEAEEHGDMVLLDMVDVYRALARKLRLFYRHLALNVNYDYVLKVDDDTWVNIPRVLASLQNDKIPLTETWYGKMRCDWATFDPDPKWQETRWRPSTYPCFGGGGGNVLTHDLADWIGLNAMNLQDYQGEDVSAGIWLSVLIHTKVSNPDYHHQWEDYGCSPTMVTVPELQKADFYILHERLTKCGSECKVCEESKLKPPNTGAEKSWKRLKSDWGARMHHAVAKLPWTLLEPRPDLRDGQRL